jgi:hypothetical protein
MSQPKEYDPDWGLNPGFQNIYIVLFQLSYLAWGNQWDGFSFHEQIAHPTVYIELHSYANTFHMCYLPLH